MVFDATIPDGNKALNLVDDDHRANNAQLVTTINKEHDFIAGSTQSGRHKYMIDEQLVIEGEGEFVNGSIAIATDAGPFSSTKKSLSWKFDGDWEHPFPMYPDEPVERSKGEWGQYTSLSVVTAQIEWDWDDGNAFKVTMSSSALLLNPEGNATDKTDKYMPVILYVTQGGGGGYTLAYDTKFYAPYGGAVIPIASTGTTMVMCQLLPDDNILVTVLPACAAIP